MTNEEIIVDEVPFKRHKETFDLNEDCPDIPNEVNDSIELW